MGQVSRKGQQRLSNQELGEVSGNIFFVLGVVIRDCKWGGWVSELSRGTLYAKDKRPERVGGGHCRSPHSVFTGVSRVGNRSMQDWWSPRGDGTTPRDYPFGQAQQTGPTGLPGDRVHREALQSAQLSLTDPELEEYCPRSVFPLLGYPGAIAHRAGREGMKLSQAGGLDRDLSRCECRRNSLLWRWFSVKQLSLFGGGGWVGQRLYKTWEMGRGF